MINEEDLGRELRTMNIIWGALLFSLAVYLFVGFFLAGGIKPSISEDALGILRAVLYAAGVFNLIIAGRVRKSMLSRGGQDAQWAVGPPGPVLQKYLFAMIVSLVICESAGIFWTCAFYTGA